jgi:hypothetical protein
VAPIPIVTPVRSKACTRLSEQLRSFLVGDDMNLATTTSTSAGSAAAAGGTGGAGGAP